MTIMTDKKKTILEAVEKLTDTYRKEELFLGKDRERLPNKKEIINFIKDMRSIIFPGYFSCLLYTSPSPRDPKTSRMPSSA